MTNNISYLKEAKYKINHRKEQLECDEINIIKALNYIDVSLQSLENIKKNTSAFAAHQFLLKSKQILSGIIS